MPTEITFSSALSTSYQAVHPRLYGKSLRESCNKNFGIGLDWVRIHPMNGSILPLLWRASSLNHNLILEGM
jgi:hypothetical protein